MLLLPIATALEAPGFLRLGPLRLPVYGIFAAAAVVAALLVSQPAARRAGLAADRVWDAGVFAVVAALVASRALLVLFNFPAFLRFPTLVLSLPSLTYTGLLLTAIAVWVYLSSKRLPWREVADAWSVSACALAAVLAIAHFVEGTDAGMPTRLPWGVVAAGDGVLGRTQPVQLYLAAGWLALGFLAWHQIHIALAPGRVAAWVLAAGGLLAYALQFFAQPAETFGDAWLDETQWVGLMAFSAGAAWWAAIASAQPPPLQQATTQQKEAA